MALTAGGFSSRVEDSKAHLVELLQETSFGMVLLDGEKPELIATMAAWGSGESIRQVPVVGLPRCTDGSLDEPRLRALVQEWMGEEEVIEPIVLS